MKNLKWLAVLCLIQEGDLLVTEAISRYAEFPENLWDHTNCQCGSCVPSVNLSEEAFRLLRDHQEQLMDIGHDLASDPCQRHQSLLDNAERCGLIRISDDTESCVGFSWTPAGRQLMTGRGLG